MKIQYDTDVFNFSFILYYLGFPSFSIINYAMMKSLSLILCLHSLLCPKVNSLKFSYWIKNIISIICYLNILIYIHICEYKF